MPQKHIIQILIFLTSSAVQRCCGGGWNAWQPGGCVPRCEKRSESRQCSSNETGAACKGVLHRSVHSKLCHSEGKLASQFHLLQHEIYGSLRGPFALRVAEDDHVSITVPKAVRVILKQHDVAIERGRWLRDWQPISDEGDLGRRVTLHLPYVSSADSGVYAFAIANSTSFELITAVYSIAVLPPANVINMERTNSSMPLLLCHLEVLECFTYT